MEEKLARGELDAAVAAHVAAPDRLRHKVLYRERFVCAMRCGHPVLNETWDTDAFCRQSFVLGSFYGGSFAGAADETLAQTGCAAKWRCRCRVSRRFPKSCAKAICWRWCPRIWCGGRAAWRYASCLCVREYSELLLWHEHSHADPVQKWLRAQLAEAAAEGADGQEAV